MSEMMTNSSSIYSFAADNGTQFRSPEVKSASNYIVMNHSIESSTAGATGSSAANMRKGGEKKRTREASPATVTQEDSTKSALVDDSSMVLIKSAAFTTATTTTAASSGTISKKSKNRAQSSSSSSTTAEPNATKAQLSVLSEANNRGDSFDIMAQSLVRDGVLKPLISLGLSRENVIEYLNTIFTLFTHRKDDMLAAIVKQINISGHYLNNCSREDRTNFLATMEQNYRAKVTAKREYVASEEARNEQSHQQFQMQQSFPFQYPYQMQQSFPFQHPYQIHQHESTTSVTANSSSGSIYGMIDNTSEVTATGEATSEVVEESDNGYVGV